MRGDAREKRGDAARCGEMPARERTCSRPAQSRSPPAPRLKAPLTNSKTALVAAVAPGTAPSTTPSTAPAASPAAPPADAPAAPTMRSDPTMVLPAAALMASAIEVAATAGSAAAVAPSWRAGSRSGVSGARTGARSVASASAISVVVESTWSAAVVFERSRKLTWEIGWRSGEMRTGRGELTREISGRLWGDWVRCGGVEGRSETTYSKVGCILVASDCHRLRSIAGRRAFERSREKSREGRAHRDARHGACERGRREIDGPVGAPQSAEVRQGAVGERQGGVDEPHDGRRSVERRLQVEAGHEGVK